MVGNGQALGGGYGRHPAPGWAGVGTTTLRDLPSDVVTGPALLLDHHSLFLVTVGHGHHEIDFRSYPCRPGTLIWARPGQVVRYGNSQDLDAIIVCWDADLVAESTPDGRHSDPDGPAFWQLTGEDEDAVITEVSQLVVDCARHGSGEAAASLLRHQLTVLLLRIFLLPVDGGQASIESAIYRRMRQEVERSYGQTRRVEDYAARLDCSVRTLTRACLAATGRSAKQVIDDRVTLQAMRLLAASEASIADIGRLLGFSEPTNFGRFFHREVGCSPGDFRMQLRHPVRPTLPLQRRPAGIGTPISPATGQALR
jgi:AraC-like DNA-binding protein